MVVSSMRFRLIDWSDFELNPSIPFCFLPVNIRPFRFLLGSIYLVRQSPIRLTIRMSLCQSILKCVCSLITFVPVFYPSSR